MSKDEQSIEAEIQAKGLNAPRLSPDKIDAVIVGEDFDAELGRKIARGNARDKIWALEGYALRERLAA